ncbi:MAG: hypothetical protein K5686_05235 [Lachnospiraceae bacterium]|nr:hypothetical protein [Lachnospiraceae bacterium]
MFGKKNKPTIDLSEDKERQALELAALEASLDFLKRPAKPAESEEGSEGDAKEITAADRARAQKFGRRMDYKTAVVKRGENSEAADSDAGEVRKDDENTVKAAEETQEKEEKPAEEAAAAEEVTGEATKEDTAAKEEAAKAEEPDAGIKPAEADEAAQEDKKEEAKADEAANEEEIKPSADRSGGIVIAEAPVPDTGKEDEAAAVQLIDNPLPTPKKHVPREMDFDIEPDADHMHFDVVDMKGKDFFDIN